MGRCRGLPTVRAMLLVAAMSGTVGSATMHQPVEGRNLRAPIVATRSAQVGLQATMRHLDGAIRHLGHDHRDVRKRIRHARRSYARMHRHADEMEGPIATGRMRLVTSRVELGRLRRASAASGPRARPLGPPTSGLPSDGRSQPHPITDGPSPIAIDRRRPEPLPDGMARRTPRRPSARPYERDRAQASRTNRASVHPQGRALPTCAAEAVARAAGHPPPDRGEHAALRAPRRHSGSQHGTTRSGAGPRREEDQARLLAVTASAGQRRGG